MRRLIETAKTHPDAQVRLHATEMVFNRAFGKPKQQLDVAGEVKHSFVLRAPGVLSTAEWEANFSPKLIEATAEPAIEGGSTSAEDGR